MKKTRILLYLSVLIVSLPLLFLGVSCDSLVGPQGPAGETGATGETGSAGTNGTNGTNGEDGEDGGNIPGGTLRIELSSGEPVTSSTLVHICFDTDTIIMSGGESIVTIPVADYYSSAGSVFYCVTWHAPDVTPGSYYVYAWIDFNGDLVFDTVTTPWETDYVFLYDPEGALSALSTPGEITNPDFDILLPNYTFWDDFAAQIDLLVQYSP